MRTEAALWYSFQGGRSEDPTGFFNSADFHWASVIEKNAELIQHEIQTLVTAERKKLQPYFNKDLIESGSKWKTFSLAFWDIHFKKNARKAPLTYSIFKSIDGAVSCSVSILEAGSRIKPHRGDTDGIIRCHLPISIPGKLPESGFRVGDSIREWKPGNLLLFNDSQEHEAWNLTASERIILIIDIIRPEHLSKRKAICRNVLSGLLLQFITSPAFLKPLYRKRTSRLFIQKTLFHALRPVQHFLG